jgi:hypothetical protein
MDVSFYLVDLNSFQVRIERSFVCGDMKIKRKRALLAIAF